MRPGREIDCEIAKHVYGHEVFVQKRILMERLPTGERLPLTHRERPMVRHGGPLLRVEEPRGFYPVPLAAQVICTAALSALTNRDAHLEAAATAHAMAPITPQ